VDEVAIHLHSLKPLPHSWIDGPQPPNFILQPQEAEFYKKFGPREIEMGRMYTKGKGVSGSTLPYAKEKPSWVKKTAEQLESEMVAMARKGFCPSKIGNILRDEQGIGQASYITGRSILETLRRHGIAPAIPEDLDFLIKRSSNIRNHLSKVRNDVDAKYRLILVDSRIYRLARYYKRTMVLPATWKPNYLRLS